MSNLESEQPAEDRLARAAGGLLRQGAEDLDADTVMRLRRARQAALAEYDHARRWPAWPGGGWQAVTAAAAVAVVAVGLWVGRFVPPAVPGDVPHPEQASALEVIPVDDNLELVEDLDFYAWMASSNGA